MSIIAALIPVTQKALNVCVYCRVRKQACDRTVPSCSRCAAKGISCDYTPSPSLPITTLEPLVLRSGSYPPCLSARGAWELVQTVTARMHAATDPTATKKLSDYVIEILNMANVNLTSILEDYGPSVRHWCPTVHDCILEQGTEVILAEHPLLALGVWLVTKTSRGQCGNFYSCRLYQALKQVLALLQTRNEAEIEVLQLGLSIAVYEVAHGMGTQAFQSLSNCKAMLTILELGALNSGNTQVLERMEWLRASLLVLDRILFVAAPSTSFGLTISPSDPICNALSSKYHPPIPPLLPTFAPTSPSKVHVRTVVALASGHALDYTNARKRNIKPNECYDTVDARISDCIKMLIENPQPSTWLHCDAIALGFCSHILLQQAQVDYLAQLPHAANLHGRKEKASLALRYSRRMAWDMAKVAFSKIESAEEVARLPFAALCCVLRAGMAVLETSESCGEHVVSKEEVKSLQMVVRWFGERWGVGRIFEARLADLLR